MIVASALLVGIVPLGSDGSGAALETWTDVQPVNAPNYRIRQAMAYDPDTGFTILFGGSGYPPGANGCCEALGDTWRWDGTNWVQLVPALSPPARQQSVMSHDPVGGGLILFGGHGALAPIGDTWRWDGTTWTQLSPAHSPPPLVAATMATDTARGRIVLFGGYTPGPTYVNQTWEWDGSDWHEMASPLSPAPRTAAAMAYDATQQRTVLYGGSGGVTILSDTWEWDGANWTAATPTTLPGARYEHEMAYDAGRRRVVLFGGVRITGPGSSVQAIDTWMWDDDNWVDLSIIGPSAHVTPQLVYDAQRSQLIAALTATCCSSPSTPTQTWTLTSPTSSPPTMLAGHIEVTEPDSGQTTAQLDVLFTAPVDAPTTVRWRTYPYTASSRDFVKGSGMLTLGAGESSAPIAISIKGDLLDEADETVIVGLSDLNGNPLPGIEGISTVTIRDNDPQPAIVISSPTFAEPISGRASLNFDVTLSAPSGRSVSAVFATEDGTATEGQDYISISRAITFAPGTTSRTISVPILSDAIIEGYEQFTITASAPINGLVSSPGIATLTDPP